MPGPSVRLFLARWYQPGVGTQHGCTEELGQVWRILGPYRSPAALAIVDTVIKIPRTASAQRNWLAAGNGSRNSPGHERTGDLVFWDSYPGHNQIGHVMIIWNTATPEQRQPVHLNHISGS